MEGRRLASTADVAHLHARGRAWGVGGADLRISVVAQAPHRTDRLPDLIVGATAAQQSAQIVAVLGKKARVELPIGRQPCARAVATERLCDGGDDADLAGAVAIPPAFGDLARVV